MGTVYSIERTNSNATPSVMNKTIQLGGRVRYARGEYEAASLSAGEVIEMFKLPNGARIVRGELSHDALGSSTTLSVGHAAYKNADGTDVALDADEFKAAAASTSLQVVDIAATVALGRNSVIDADENGFMVTATIAGAAGTGTIVVQMEYVLD